MTRTSISVALNPMGYPHFTDHLAAVAVTMNIPLVFTDVVHYEQTLRLYPELKVQIHEWQEFTPRFIVEHYDVLFISEMWNRTQIRLKFESYEKELDKQIRVVHCPHGFSDKGFWFELCLEQDITLVYGQNMLDLIASRQPNVPMGPHVVTGNLRYAYYKRHKEFFDKTVQSDVLNRFAKQQPTIFYAPTWRDPENSSSFFDAAEQLLSRLPADYNLLIKLHPNLEHDQDLMVRVYEIISKYEDKPNVVILTDYPLIYPIASACDLYIGDRSAVGYDFLAFQKPMFFLNQRGGDAASDRESYLTRCGVVIESHAYDRIFSIIEKNLPQDTERFKDRRKQVYDYSFGTERSLDEVREEIIKAYS